MFVSSYQIHNVLNLYSKQLSQGKSGRRGKTETKKSPCDQINLSAEGKRRATIERVAEDILNKIFHDSTSGKIKTNPHALSGKKEIKHSDSDRKKETAFVFNSIDALNRKTKTALSVKDTKYLIGRPEKPANDVIEKD